MLNHDFPKNFNALVDGTLSEAQAIEFLTLSDNGAVVAHLVSAAEILRARAVKLDGLSDGTDLCGTGGDGTGTVNVSTAAAIVVASCGVSVAKHGNRAASSRSGSSDVLAALGIAPASDSAAAQAQFSAFGITFISAPAFHPALLALAPLRRKIGRRTIFNLLGPLINPANVTKQLVGVYATDLLRPVAQALRQLGSASAWTVHGQGLDELTVTGTSLAVALDGAETTIDPAALGLGTWKLADLRGGTPDQNAASLVATLAGAKGAYRDIVLLNAGAALVIAGKANILLEGIEQARIAIDSGASLDLVHRMRHQ